MSIHRSEFVEGEAEQRHVQLFVADDGALLESWNALWLATNKESSNLILYGMYYGHCYDQRSEGAAL